MASNTAWSVLKILSAYKDAENPNLSKASLELTLWKKKIDRHYRFFTHTAVCFVYEGSFLLTVGEKTYVVNAGDLYVIRPGTEWSCSFSGKETVRVLSVNFSGSLSDTIIKDYLGEKGIFFSQSGCRGLADALLATSDKKDISTRELFDEFMLFLLRMCQRLSSNLIGKEEPTLSRRIRHHILHYATRGKLSVKSIANAFSIRVQDLQELWKESFGVTVHRYIQEVRLERAAELLLMSNVSISQIAEETGYADRHYLDKLFLKKYGKTPSAYRKSHGRTE